MDVFSLERDDTSRLAESFPRKTVSLVLRVSEQVHNETLKYLLKRKSETDKSQTKIKKSICDLKSVISAIESGIDCNLEEIFESSNFMVNQRKLIPQEMLKFSVEKFEAQLQKSLTRLTISLDKCQAKSDSLASIIKDHGGSKKNTLKKVTKEIYEIKKKNFRKILESPQS